MYIYIRMHKNMSVSIYVHMYGPPASMCKEHYQNTFFVHKRVLPRKKFAQSCATISFCQKSNPLHC